MPHMYTGANFFYFTALVCDIMLQDMTHNRSITDEDLSNEIDLP